jgi:hypothetical protein
MKRKTKSYRKPRRDVQLAFPSLKPGVSDKVIDPDGFVAEAANMRRPAIVPLGDSIELEIRRLGSEVTDLFLWESRASDRETATQRVAATEAFFQKAVHLGFVAALQHFRKEIASTPKGARVLEALRVNSAKGAAVRRKQAEPAHREIRKRFRELRKTTPKKTVRYLRVAEEFGMSDRHVARVVEGID